MFQFTVCTSWFARPWLKLWDKNFSELQTHPPLSSQARKKSTKINFLGPETARWGGGLPREGVGVENFVLSLETLSSLGFEERDLGCPGNFAGMSRTPGGVQKFVQKKFVRIFRSLLSRWKNRSEFWAPKVLFPFREPCNFLATESRKRLRFFFLRFFEAKGVPIPVWAGDGDACDRKKSQRFAIVIFGALSQRAPNPPEFAQPRLSRVKVGGKKVYTKGVVSSENLSASTGKKQIWCIPKSLF